MSLRIGVDIGGTFTDLVLLDTETGRLTNAKVLTTPFDPSEGVLTGLAAVLDLAGHPAADVAQVIHGTTLVANAIIERKGVATAFIATAGFRDLLDMAREWRWDIYDLDIVLPPPLVPRHRCVEVIERIGPDGAVATEFDEASAIDAARAVAGMGVEAVAVCFLHAFRNPAHERRMAEILGAHAPDVAVSLSSEVSPTLGEYDRACTTAANAYVQPVFRRYIARLSQGMRAMGIGVDLLLMQSDGGTAHETTARRLPIRLVQSGPAGGAQAAALAGGIAGFSDVMAFDMGGTTAKACLIPDGKPVRAPDFEVARIARFRRGSGLPLKVPAVDMIEIGAGGGSIARVNALGLIQVGPDSSSADPGPACYGRGGGLATVTDADLLLGYLDERKFLGGDMRLDRAAAASAIQAAIADPLGLTVLQAALGIHDTVNETMAQAAAIHALEKGLRAQDFALVAIGGAGPVHACQVAARIGITTVICPAGAGVASAFGFLAAPVSFEAVQARLAGVNDLDEDSIAAILAPLRDEARRNIAEAGLDPDRCTVSASVELRYAGQGHEVEAPLADGADIPSLIAAFEARYLALYGRIERDAAIEAVTWRVIASGPKPVLPPRATIQGGAAQEATRPIWCRHARAMVAARVHDRYAMAPGDLCHGPCVVEERESTAVIPHGATATLDAGGNLIISLDTAP